MSHHRTLRVPAMLAIALLVAGGGCKGCAAQSAKADGAGTKDSGPPTSRQLQPLDERVLAMGGEIDVENRYRSTVMVTAEWGEQGRSHCSGVLIHPRLVVTAGHCLCLRRTAPAQEGGFIIDNAACAARATVTTVTYKPPRMTDSEHRGHEGEVQPHRELKVLLDPQGNVVSSSADLAVIFLEEPLSEDFRPIALADEEARINEPVTIVGYGYDEIADGHNGDRRFSENQITQLSASGGRALFVQPGRHVYKGDSGGPCLREGAQGATLVGISTRGLGQGAAFTSTFFYREWLHEEIRRAEELR